MIASRPAAHEYAPYYSRYIDRVPEGEILTVLALQVEEMLRLGAEIRPEQQRFRYADGKWSVREVCGHMTDAERVFGYRAFCISRGDRTALPGFDENTYVTASRYDERDAGDLLAELVLVRRSNLEFLNRLNDEEWRRIGTASDNPVSVRALAYMMGGHVRHHLHGLRTSYGIAGRP